MSHLAGNGYGRSSRKTGITSAAGALQIEIPTEAGVINATRGSHGLWKLSQDLPGGTFQDMPSGTFPKGIHGGPPSSRLARSATVMEAKSSSNGGRSFLEPHLDGQECFVDIPITFKPKKVQDTLYTIAVKDLTYKIVRNTSRSTKSSSGGGIKSLLAPFSSSAGPPATSPGPPPVASSSIPVSGPLTPGFSRLSPDPSSNKAYLLKNVSCQAFPGEILAVAGPSGAGKSTFLDALAGRIKASSLEGGILVNGRPVESKAFRRITGYVMQDDALFPMLTVRETLLYSARLRLPGDMSMREKRERVDELLLELGLQDVAGTRIGSAEARGVSGGERRRVSIGVDLIHDPAVLLLDEPTSGLDSSAALNVSEILQSMAVKGRRTVILSIHQPSFRILELFHRLLVLAHGAVVHHGSLHDLVQRLRAVGLEIPPHVNALEYTIDTLDTRRKRPGKHVKAPPPASPSSLSRRFQAAVLAPLSPRRQVDIESAPLPPASDIVQAPNGYANCRPIEAWTLASRYYKNIFRTKELFNGRAAQMLVCAMCLGTLFLRVGDDVKGIQERLGFLAFTLAFLLTSSVEALPIFLQERHILIRETTRGAYRMSSYLFASTVVFFPFLLAMAVMFACPAYWLVGLAPNVGSFLFFLLVVWLTLILANAIVSAFAAVAPDYITGNSMIAGVMGAHFLFSGYFIAKKYIPRYWIWMHYLSIFKYPFDALLVNEYGSRRTACFAPLAQMPDGSMLCPHTGQQILEDQKLASNNKWMDVGIIIAFIIIYKLICYIALRFQKSGVRR